ncbi:MAG: hypothetical protein ACK5NK_05515 [Niabella sp.]
MTYILIAVFVWIMYYFVSRVVLPVYFTTKKVKEQFKNMREQQEAYMNRQQPSPEPSKDAKKEKVGEYIEFEEIK